MEQGKFKQKKSNSINNNNTNNHIEPSNKVREHIVYLIHKACVKVLKTPVVNMAFKHISKVIEHSRTSFQCLRIRAQYNKEVK